MKIYVASSWRNSEQQELVVGLRYLGHEVYDFKNPREGNHGFHWSEVGLKTVGEPQQEVEPEALRKALKHPRAVEGFASDFNAMMWADACVLLLPCGRSAHIEAGWMAGAGKPTFVFAPCKYIEPELMYGLTRRELCVTFEELKAALHAHVWLE